MNRGFEKPSMTAASLVGIKGRAQRMPADSEPRTPLASGYRYAMRRGKSRPPHKSASALTALGRHTGMGDHIAASMERLRASGDDPLHALGIEGIAFGRESESAKPRRLHREMSRQAPHRARDRNMIENEGFAARYREIETLDRPRAMFHGPISTSDILVCCEDLMIRMRRMIPGRIRHSPSLSMLALSPADPR